MAAGERVLMSRLRNEEEFDTDERRRRPQFALMPPVSSLTMPFSGDSNNQDSDFEEDLESPQIPQFPEPPINLPDSQQNTMVFNMEKEKFDRYHNRYGLSKKQRRAYGRAGARDVRVLRKLYPPNKYYYTAHPRNEESLATYGKNYWSATPLQRAARFDDRVAGRGRFSLLRQARQLRGIGRALGTNRMTSDLARSGASLAMANLAAADAMEGEGAYMGATRGLGGRGSYSAPFVNDSAYVEAGSLFYKPHFSADASSHDDGGLVISNQEYICNLYGCPSGTTFQSTSYTINPGLAEVFPMLSQFAVNFERYEMIQCVFHFETQLDAGIIQSSTGQVGDVLMYSHSDPNQPELQNISEFQMNGGNSVRVTQGLACGVECDPVMLSGLPNAGINYIRTGPVEDTDEYDQAKIQVAVSNTPTDLANQVIGKLYVSYTVRLIKPKIMSYLGRGQLSDEFYVIGRCGTGANPSASYTYTNKLDNTGITYTPDQRNNIGCTVNGYATTETIQGIELKNRLEILLPAWYQGLLLVTIITKTYQSGAEPSDGGEYPKEGDNQYLLGEGNVQFPEMIRNINIETNNSPVIEQSNIMTVSRAATTESIYEAAVSFCVRVAPALTTDNKIIYSHFSAQTLESAMQSGTIIKIRTMNDWGAVGMQSLSDISW